MTTATKIVLFWVALFMLMIPSAFLGWRWSVGVACGFGLACLLAWREFRP